MNIPIVFEDEWLLVVDKPSGLLTIPTPKKETRTLTSILNDDLRLKNKTYRLHPCHRLDRETSGLIIYAKGKSIQQKIMQEFKERRVKKTYFALVQGRLPCNQGSLSFPVEGKNSITEYKVVKAGSDFTAVEAAPLTGRTNQIRIHFKSFGHPILGDTKFALRRDFKIKAKRLCLHASYLRFSHPVTKESLSLSAVMPLDIKKLLERG